MEAAVAIIVVVVLAAAVVFMFLTTARRRATTGDLSRETRRRDRSQDEGETVSSSTEIEAAGRARSEETRAMAGDVPATRAPGDVVQWEPVDEEEIGVSRRQFLNRAVLTVGGFSVGALGAGILGFVWPVGGGGFGGVVNAGSLDDILGSIDERREPLYVPEARTYLQRYPRSALDAAQAVEAYQPVMAGYEEGVVALFQKCVHLGCRVPWCASSQWFECPCHGSKYNAVGEKKDGPAPRGLDRFVVTVDGGRVSIDTSVVITGPQIGTDTTEQKQEGPSCV